MSALLTLLRTGDFGGQHASFLMNDHPLRVAKHFLGVVIHGLSRNRGRCSLHREGSRSLVESPSWGGWVPAVGLKCGSFKFGSFNPCDKCGALPDTEDDYALSVIYSSHFFPHQELEDIVRQIAGGKRAVLKPDMLPPEMMRIIVEQSQNMKAMCEKMWNNAKEPPPKSSASPDPK